MVFLLLVNYLISPGNGYAPGIMASKCLISLCCLDVSDTLLTAEWPEYSLPRPV